MHPVEIIWEENGPPPELDPADLQTALASFLSGLSLPPGGLSVLVAGDAALRELNHAHRGLDRPTDVLSWSYLDALPPGEETPLLGELALSLEQAARQATENGWDLRTEVLRLLAHGCVHLAGHDHQTPEEDARMKALEVRLLTAIGLPGLYPEEG